MQKIKNSSLLAECQKALEDNNLELCLQLLSNHFPSNQEVINQRGRLNGLNKEERNGTISSEEYRRERNRIRVALITFVDENVLPDDEMPNHEILDDEDEVLEGIHNRILIITFKDSFTNWEMLFPKAFFSHRCIINYGEEVPTDYLTPDVIIFDDSGPNARPYMVRFAEKMPQAHLLYFGELNPFTESRKRNLQDAAFFDRCANANSKFTIHARLRELLEFRKIFGGPTS